jgi:hypothetical protein
MGCPLNGALYPVAKYLLPCRCGQQIVVEPREAGRTASCRCGASLQIPTMLEMTALEITPEAVSKPPRKAAWAWPQAMKLAGTLVALVGIGIVVSFYLGRPRINPNAPEILRHSASQLSPSRAWIAWEDWQQAGVGSADPRQLQQITDYHVRQGVAGCVALAGLALVAIGAIAAKSRQSGVQERSL